MKLIAPGITAIDSPFLSKENTGLGNVLFQIAAAYGVAKDSGCAFSSFFLQQFADKLKSLFGFHHANTIFLEFLKDTDSTTVPTEKILDRGGKKYDPTILATIEKSTSPCIKLEGHFESPMYFHKYREDILRMMRPTQMEEFLRTNMPVLFDPDFTPISLHIRNGKDAVKFKNGYYKNAVEMILSFVAKPFFFIFIDDLACAPFLPQDIGITHFMCVHSQEDFIDLFIISYCKHHIASNSTFSWWGVYLCTNPGKKTFISRGAVDFSIRTNNLSEDEYLENYFLGDTYILPDI